MTSATYLFSTRYLIYLVPVPNLVPVPYLFSPRPWRVTGVKVVTELVPVLKRHMIYETFVEKYLICLSIHHSWVQGFQKQNKTNK